MTLICTLSLVRCCSSLGTTHSLKMERPTFTFCSETQWTHSFPEPESSFTSNINHSSSASRHDQLILKTQQFLNRAGSVCHVSTVANIVSAVFYCIDRGLCDRALCVFIIYLLKAFSLRVQIVTLNPVHSHGSLVPLLLKRLFVWICTPLLDILFKVLVSWGQKHCGIYLHCAFWHWKVVSGKEPLNWF